MKIESLIGEAVIHKSFGNGVIKAAYDKYLEVEFPERKKQSRRKCRQIWSSGRRKTVCM